MIDVSKSKETIKDLVHSGKNDDLVLQHSQKDELGITHNFYQQLYKGIKVENAMYAAHSKNGYIESVNGKFLKIGEVETSAKISEKEALDRALNATQAYTYKWQLNEEEQLIKKVKNDESATFFPRGELVILYSQATNSYRLSYKFDIFAHYPLSHNNVFIDAITGEVLEKQNLIFDINSTGTAATRYSGTQSITTDSYTGGYHLNELTNSVIMETHNMRNQGSNYSGAPLFSDNDNIWTAAEYHSNLDDAALDAHWGVERVYNYWQSVRNVNSWNGSGGALLNYVHADLHSINSYFTDNDNAFWDGTRMTYGDGTTAFNPIVSLDVIAHETGHGYCSGVSIMRNLTYSILSSGNEALALNEGMSDIWAACVEQWAAPTKQTWKVGEEIMKNGFSCLRSLSNPTTQGWRLGYSSEGNYPDTYGHSPWYSDADPSTFAHVNSTVLGHWFYLLSAGGSGTNGLGNSYTVLNVGISNAAAIAWRAELYYFTATTNFSQARDATIQAATDLSNGNANSFLVMQVRNAWYAVGLGSQPTQTSIAGPWLLCSSGGTYTVNNPPTGTLSWQKSTNIDWVSGTNPAIFRANGFNNYSGWIQAYFDGIPGPIINVWSGRFDGTVVTGTASVCPGSLYVYTAQVPGGHSSAYSYSWTYPSNWMKNNQYQNTVQLQTPMYSMTYGAVRVSITNSCGTSGYSGITVYPGSGCPHYFTVYPNPASDNVTITMIDNSPSNADTAYVNQSIANSNVPVSFTIRIYNSQSSLISSVKRSGTNFSVPLTNMRDGTYIVEVSDGKTSTTQTLIVKHN